MDVSWSIDPDPSNCSSSSYRTTFACPIPFQYGENMVSVTARAPDGATATTYTVAINDATLGNMSVSCSPTSIISGRTTTCTASCNTGNDTNFTWSVTPSESGYCTGNGSSVSCALTKTTQSSATIAANSMSCNPGVASV